MGYTQSRFFILIAYSILLEKDRVELQEYQVKSLLSRFGIKSPSHVIVDSHTDVEPLVSELAGTSFVVRPQADGASEYVSDAKELVQTIQTCLHTEGPVSKLLIMPDVASDQAFRITVAVDFCGDIVLSACRPGQKVFSERLFEGSLRPFQIHRLVTALSLRDRLLERCIELASSALQIFFQYDATYLDIGPIAVTENGLFQALNARMVCDDRALYRQPELQQMSGAARRKPQPIDPPCTVLEKSGAVSCLANGRGLALATADTFHFLNISVGRVVDIGVEVSAEHLRKGFALAGSASAAVLHLFTGLTDCEKIARQIVSEQVSIPLAVYFEGTNEAGGRKLIEASCSKCKAAVSLDEAIRMAGSWVVG